ncbi:hypothetical protein COW57_02035 [Candidatus Roizmanbacteria bacterium CG17_big_fil_post_rev_8_21_14_2_50_39_7]|uniref:Uncharacterized protein n=1 Tax=Candidatus Roizmanbacteria bacterium CG17_big_fil_post_rev_8_21_14_2_50_39_7 TaxID=1974858 RepID=A0A2M7EKC0_9BACT|nr:MAG: hypothetical protein COW57_02035 [Candidatus Roizmanbacteria bacterium CG17_big_fil_post_rev_8_21_14_2_50_39_7]
MFFNFCVFLHSFLRRLSADSNFPLAALTSGGGVASAAPNDFAISQMVLVFGKIRTYFKENC